MCIILIWFYDWLCFKIFLLLMYNNNGNNNKNNVLFFYFSKDPLFRIIIII